MTVQKKLWAFDDEFWRDLDKSISYMVRDLLMGRDVARVARELHKVGVEKCSDSLLYKWANPNDERLPSAKALLLLVKITENCGPVSAINEACNIAKAHHTGDLAADLRTFLVEWERLKKKNGE